MTTPLKIDFEFASTLDLKKVGIYRITEHASTFVRCYAATWGDRRGYFLDPDKPPGWLIEALNDDTVPIHAHNATVERLMIERICGPRHGWPVPRKGRWRCSAAQARRLALPGALDKLGAALGAVDTLAKDPKGKRLIHRLSKPVRRSEDGWVFDNDPEKLEDFGRYCLQDVIAEDHAESRMLPVPPQEHKYWQLTEKINDRGVRIDVNLVKRLIHRANEATEELNARIRELTGGAVQSLTNVAQIKQWLWDEYGVELVTLRKEDMEGLLAEAADLDLPKRAKDVLRIRQAGAKSSVAKLLAILRRVSADGRLHGAFVYHGASTGRYTSMGVQLQNLVRDVLKDFDEAIKDLDNFSLEQISKALRGCFIPKPGHVFVDADYSAIEARGVGWLAGCKKLLTIYRTGRDPYCEMASLIYGFTVVKGVNDDERWTGKQTILGCGYGMGPDKFEAQCIKFGKSVGLETAGKAVRAYREEFPEIPQLWRDMENAAIRAVRFPGETCQIPNGLIKFRFVSGYLQMALPSGRRLFYKDPYIRQEDKFNTGRPKPVLWFWGINPKTKQWAREKTWGGTLTENAVQAISRDLLFGAMERLEDEFEIPLVLSVHDQIVGEVLEEDGPWAVRQVRRAMTESPPWARGFPVEAEPKIMQRFGK